MTSVPEVTESTPAAKPISRLARMAGAAAAILGGLAWLGVLYLIVTKVPPFERLFEKFEIRGGMPDLTETVIAISHPVAGLWPLWALAITAIAAGIAYASVKATRRLPVAAAMVFGFFSCLGCMLAVQLITAALFAPLAELIKQTSRS
jgi:hypothetical protein